MAGSPWTKWEREFLLQGADFKYFILKVMATVGAERSLKIARGLCVHIVSERDVLHFPARLIPLPDDKIPARPPGR